MRKETYLNDTTFLKHLDEIKYKIILTKLEALDKQGRVEEELIGRSKEGSSLTIDGSSTVRRSCSLTLTADIKNQVDFAYIQSLLSINRKMILSIGIKNIYQQRFPQYNDIDIFWFPLGTFYIGTVSYSNSLDGLDISLGLNDKMCLLNGENGGTIPADVTLNTMETYIPEVVEGESIDTSNENQEIYTNVATGRMVLSTGEQVPVEQIIRELVNHFGGEDLNNILLDLPENIRLCQTWGGNSFSLFCDYEDTQEKVGKRYLKNYGLPKKYYLNDETRNEKKKAANFVTSAKISNSINDSSKKFLMLRKKQMKIDDKWYDYFIMKDGPVEDPDTTTYGTLEANELENTIDTNSTVSTTTTTSTTTSTTTTFKYDDGVDAEDIVLLNAEGDIGFTLTDLVYPNTSNDFVASKGSAITDSLDDIAQKLENYEYFYDRNGNFVFQEIKNYLNTSQSTDMLNTLQSLQNSKNKIDVDYSLTQYRDTSLYDLTDSPLIIDISNDPQYSLVKNDFVIWGENGAGLPIRYHLAIDTIPKMHKYYQGYWMYSKMVSLDSNTDSTDTSEGNYTNTLTALDTGGEQTPYVSKDDFPKEGMTGCYYYCAGRDYADNSRDPDKVYYWNGADYFILFLNGSGKYSFVFDADDPLEQTYWAKYGDSGTKEWTKTHVEQSENNTIAFDYYEMYITENNKEQEAAQIALDQIPYTRVIKATTYSDEGKEVTDTMPEVQYVNDRGYKVRYVVYNTEDDWRSAMFLAGKLNELDGTSNENYYYAELKNEWPKIVDIAVPPRAGSNLIGDWDGNDDDTEIDGITLELKDELDLTHNTYYLDILNPSDKIKQFSIDNIGRRSSIYTETGVNCIFEGDLPSYCYIDSQTVDRYKTVEYIVTTTETNDEGEEVKKETTYKDKVLTDFSIEYMVEKITEPEETSNLSDNQRAFLQQAYDDICEQIKGATELGYDPVVLYHSQFNKLQGGGTACSAYEQAKNIIYSGTCYNEKVTVTMMPVYYLEPHTRIRLQDTSTGVSGDYVIDSIDLPLDGTGTMSLICSRALTKM